MLLTLFMGMSHGANLVSEQLLRPNGAKASIKSTIHNEMRLLNVP